MKRTIQAVLFVLVLLTAYAAWPLVGLKGIVDAVQAKDAATLSERIDRPALKRSLIDQIGRAYLRVSGKDQGLNEFEIRIALQIAATLAGAKVDEMLSPSALINLLEQSGGTAPYGNLQVGLPGLEAPSFANLGRLVRNTEYSGTNFYILLPLTSDEQTGYRLRLTLQDWTWKLSGIGLPEQVKTRIASEIARSQPNT
ncbi:MAG: DUF2939 domain-containing protein [Pseudolabrys sp.]|nr:DUF2939 domain-containing protein [Pseudolabrys sp.]